MCQSLFSLFFTNFSKNLAKSLQRKEIKVSYFFCFVTLCDISLNKSLYYIDLLFSSLKLCLLNHKSPIFFLSFCPGLFDRVSMCVRVLACWCVRSLIKSDLFWWRVPYCPATPSPFFRVRPPLKPPTIPATKFFAIGAPLKICMAKRRRPCRKDVGLCIDVCILVQAHLKNKWMCMNISAWKEKKGS